MGAGAGPRLAGAWARGRLGGHGREGIGELRGLRLAGGEKRGGQGSPQLRPVARHLRRDGSGRRGKVGRWSAAGETVAVSVTVSGAGRRGGPPGAGAIWSRRRQIGRLRVGRREPGGLEGKHGLGGFRFAPLDGRRGGGRRNVNLRGGCRGPGNRVDAAVHGMRRRRFSRRARARGARARRAVRTSPAGRTGGCNGGAMTRLARLSAPDGASASDVRAGTGAGLTAEPAAASRQAAPWHRRPTSALVRGAPRRWRRAHALRASAPAPVRRWKGRAAPWRRPGSPGRGARAPLRRQPRRGRRQGFRRAGSAGRCRRFAG
jgi:hypothetical protein